MKYFHIRIFLLIWASVFLCQPLLKSQISIGTVVDIISGESLNFVHIGVSGKNVGVISDDKGRYKIDVTNLSKDECITFSIIGYKTECLSKALVMKKDFIVELSPISYHLQEVVITTEEQEEIKLGRFKTSKITTGQSGIDTFGFGGEWGILIKYPGQNYYLNEVSFHTRFNTVDSVLYRINAYSAKSNLPEKSILHEEVFTKSYSKDKWIKSNILAQNLLIESDIITTFELVQIWYKANAKNHLFYTHGKGYEEGMSYSKDSSHDKWKINKRGPIAMYVSGIQMK